MDFPEPQAVAFFQIDILCRSRRDEGASLLFASIDLQANSFKPLNPVQKIWNENRCKIPAQKFFCCWFFRSTEAILLFSAVENLKTRLLMQIESWNGFLLLAL